jgi:hypothetical protein
MDEPPSPFAITADTSGQGGAGCNATWQSQRRADGGGKVTSPDVKHAEIDGWSGVDGIEPDGQRRSSSFDGGDLAVAMACLDPGAVLVRQRGGTGTSVMRREADGAWYFVD